MDSAALPRQNTATAASMRASAASVRGNAAFSPSPSVVLATLPTQHVYQWPTSLILTSGLSAVPGAPDLVLAADSAIGAAYQINMRTGTPPALGINGLHVRGGALYFTNWDRGTFARVPISVGAGGVEPAGRVEVLGAVQSPAVGALFHDFSDRAGRAWVTMHPGALTLLFPCANGTWGQENAAGDPAGNSAVFTDPTSAAFGRREGQEKIMYVTMRVGEVVRVDTESVEI
ncbi:hypothetical protein FB451DRAFT_1411256 [Mycena latifolia]|nr:hypothetical protein FB451DRAFT_1411256 [Mycena latifolia]